MSRRTVQFAAVLLLALVTATPLLAAEGGGDDPVNTGIGWFFRWVNSGLLIGYLTYLIVKKAPAFFRARAGRIAGAISEAQQAKQAAEAQLRDAERRLANLGDEVAQMRAAAQQDGTAEAERIRAMARDEAAKIGRTAQSEIEAAERAARMELKSIAARLAVERAEAIVKGKVTPEAQTALVRAFVENLGRAS